MQIFLACLLFLNNFQGLLSRQEQQLTLPAVPGVTCWKEGHEDRVLRPQPGFGGPTEPGQQAPQPARGRHSWKALQEPGPTAGFYVGGPETQRRKVPCESGPPRGLYKAEAVSATSRSPLQEQAANPQAGLPLNSTQTCKMRARRLHE